MEKGGREGRPVETHAGQVIRDLQRVAEVGFPGPADLALVGLSGEDIGFLKGDDLLLADIGRDLLEDVVEADHGRERLFPIPRPRLKVLTQAL